jgi:outer membrane protein
MRGNFVLPVIRFCAALLIGTIVLTPVDAADLGPPVEPLPPAPPIFYVHAGALGLFPETNAQATGGGLFPVANIAIRPNYTLGLEVGYYITPNIAIVLSSGVPPIAHFKATGDPEAGALGTNLIGSVRYGPVALLLRYQFTQFGAFQPYGGIGVAYLLNLGNISDGPVTNFSVDQNFGLALQAGADYMLTPNWGVFVDGKKVFLSTDAQGLYLGTTPVRAHVTIDPWIATAGITFKY